jgi:OOP family OmpA-OmpF porin
MKQGLIIVFTCFLFSCKTSKVDASKRLIMSNITKNLVFKTGTDILISNFEDEFQYMLGFMLAKRNSAFEIAGHTDSVGAKDRNLELSQQRADKIKLLLINKGFDGSKLKAVGYGERQPIATNKSQEGRDANRRIEIYVIPN